MTDSDWTRQTSNDRVGIRLNCKSGVFGVNAPVGLHVVQCQRVFFHAGPCRVGSVGSVSASRTKRSTNCLPAWHACVRVGVWQCSPTV